MKMRLPLPLHFLPAAKLYQTDAKEIGFRYILCFGILIGLKECNGDGPAPALVTSVGIRGIRTLRNRVNAESEKNSSRAHIKRRTEQSREMTQCTHADTHITQDESDKDPRCLDIIRYQFGRVFC